MRKRLMLPFAGFAFTVTALACAAQTAPAQASPAPGSTQAPTQNGNSSPIQFQNPVTAAPAQAAAQPADPSPLNAPPAANSSSAAFPAAPTPISRDTPVASAPAYGGQTAQPAFAPAPLNAPPPVVLPAQPTAQTPYTSMPQYGPYVPYGVPNEDRKKHAYGSAYIPVDSWVYDAFSRLYSLGFADTMFLSVRPYTRQAAAHILEKTEDDVRGSNSDEAKEILAKLQHELRDETPVGDAERGTVYGTRSVYTRLMGISGITLRDSYHLGQTIVNDYGRLYQPGFNNLTGFTLLAERGRFSFDFRGEYEHAPSALGYSQALTNQISTVVDGIDNNNPFNARQRTIPTGPITAANPFRVVEANASFFVAGHELSFGKSDAWLGPGKGGALGWSNNAENIYGVRINRVEPLHIPYVSALLGPIRYDFFYGSLKGHTEPNHPYVHAEMLSFRPTKNVEFGFQRTIVFGGAGHEPVTLHTFLKGFFDINDTTFDEKYSRNDPGARFSDFNFSWRLPFISHYATLYTDSIAHDDVTPPSAPRRAAYRVGLYLSQIPAARKFDFRVEGVNTDPPVTRSLGGTFNYYETVHRQAYTNQGFIMGDWIGREAKGGQAWMGYHFSGNEMVELEYLHKKNARDFIPGGTTQNSFKLTVVKRFHHDDLELNGWFQYERFKAPIYLAGPQSNTTTAIQLTFFPKLKTVRAH